MKKLFASVKSLENKLRSQLKKEGFVLIKSRTAHSVDNNGSYRIVDMYTNVVQAGERFDLSLEDVQKWIDE